MARYRIALTLGFVCSVLLAQNRPQAFIGAQIIPIEGAEIPNGVLVVLKGKVIAVGGAGTIINGALVAEGEDTRSH